MESFGEYVRHAREVKALTLDEVASLTRIQSNFLHALEKDDWEHLPEEVFTKGFVRTYARLLGINEEDALQRFSAASRAFYQKAQEDKGRVQKQLEEERRKKVNRNVVTLVTGAILIGLVFLLPREQMPLLSQIGMDKKGEHRANRIENGSPVNEHAPESAPVQGMAVDSKGEAGGSAGLGRQSPDPLLGQSVGLMPTDSDQNLGSALETDEEASLEPIGSSPLILELEATELTWVVVRADDTGPHEALLQPGETVMWKASERFIVTLGNAGGVLVTLNGEPRNPFGESGQVVRDIQFTR